MNYSNDSSGNFEQDWLRLEAVTVCVGFDDILDETLSRNHPHVDTLIVVTSHDDRKTHAVAKKYSAVCVMTDLHKKNGRHFNKGAAVNAGFGYFQYHGWRMHLDADIVLPDNFRRMLFNHTCLDPYSIYGLDRVDVIGKKELRKVRAQPQHGYRVFVGGNSARPHGHRYVDPLHGWLPIGYFQLWHSCCQKPYPYSIGDASHDDLLFSALWPRERRHLLPTMVAHHLCARPPVHSENWDGFRRQPRID